MMTDRNLVALHRRQGERLGSRTAIRYKRYGWYEDLSWRDYLTRSQACAAALLEAGVQPGDRVGLWSANRLEWLMADMAIMAAGGVNVPAHATLSPQQVAYQFKHAEIAFLFLANRQQWDSLRDLVRDIPTLRGTVIFDEALNECPSWAGFLAQGSRLLPERRSRLDAIADQLGPEDLATIMYTSGTTGNPKGVMLSHGNLQSNAVSMIEGTQLNEDSVVLNWLPFSHIYARLVDHYLTMVVGCTLCLAESQETLLADIQATQPTSLCAVPRFYEKVLAAVGGAETEQSRKRLKALFGRRIRWLNSGGAPLPFHVAKAFTDAGLLLLQGYGLTESSPVISFNRVDANKLGTVGQAVQGVEIKIAEDGEVLSRGPHIMKGYWKDPQATAEAIRDGWLHTGDLGHIDEQGYLSITGRKKELLVLSNGKKVIPTEIENRLLADPCIDQVVVCGEGRHYLTALVVPNFAALREEAAKVGVNESDHQRLVEHPKVIEIMRAKIDDALADAATWEKIRKFVLLPRPFTQEADELTVSLKLRRGIIMDKYREAIEGLYA